MIPRYHPTYSVRDLITSLSLSVRGTPLDDLRCKISQMYGAKHVFLLGKARTALYILLKAYNRPGDVILPAYNCIVVPEAVLYAGYQPRFVDIDLDSLNMSLDAVKSSLASTTTVVLATHQFGIPCDIEGIVELCRDREILIVEDAAAAIGATYRGKLVGTFGDAVILSFNSTKVVSGGTGGALLLNDDALADRVSDLINTIPAVESGFVLFGKSAAWKVLTSPFLYRIVYLIYRLLHGEDMFETVALQERMPTGFLGSCSTFTAALTLGRLVDLDRNLERRRRIAQIYASSLTGCPQIELPKVSAESSPAWIGFPVKVARKRDFFKYMQSKGIDLSWTFRYSCADSFDFDGFPNARRAAQTVLGFPTYPSLSDEQAKYICTVTKEYLFSMN